MKKNIVLDASQNGNGRMKVQDTRSSRFLSDLVTHTKYAGYIPSLERRQSWDECIDESMEMHIRKYPMLEEEIKYAFNNFVRPKHVLPSMRSVQFGGIPIEFAPNRIYNCSYAPCEHEFIFAEFLFLLLGGTGTGYSVRKRHIKKLSMVKTPDGSRRFMIGDSIEGWADSVRQLTYAYLKGNTLPEFDYRDIRPKGSLIKKTGGRAPGPDKLILCHQNINNVLKQGIGRRLTSLEVHDICCYLADCVLAGVREAAMIAIFDLDDMDMITAKGIFQCEKIKLLEETEDKRIVKFKLKEKQIMNTNTYGKEDRYGYLTIEMTRKFGDWDYDNLMETGELSWYYIHPQRARANNSAALRRGEVKENQFRQLWKRTEESKSGDPGILWVNDDDSGTNPSLRSGTKVLTSNGIFNIEKLENTIFKVKNLNGIWSPAKCFLSGNNKRLYEVKLEDGSIYHATKEHKWAILDKNDKFQRTYGRWNKKKTTELKAGMELPLLKNTSISHSNIGNKDDGFIIGWLYGDGWISIRKSTNKVQYGMCISADDAKNGILDKMQKIIPERFGENVDFRFRKDRNLYEICLNSEKSRKFFDKFGVNKKEFGLPSKIWNSLSDEFIFRFIDGLFSSDEWAYKHKNANSIRIGFTSVNKKMINDVKELLGFYGILGNIRKNKPVKSVTFPNGITSTNCKISYQYRISHINNTHWFSSLFSLSHIKKQKVIANIDRYLPKNNNTIKVVSVNPTEIYEDVWDISVYDDTHCFQLATCVTGNCGEISLLPYQFCNLTTAVVYDVKSQEELDERVRVAAFIGTLQAGYTNYHYLRPVWQDTTEKEALLGVSMTGIASGAVLEFDLKKAARVAVKENEKISKRIGINPAARLTCVKPEGCLTSDTIISTKQGILTLEEIGDTDGEMWQEHDYDCYTDDGVKNSKKFYVNGKSNTKIVTLDSGLVLEGTKIHEFKVIRNNKYDWIESKDLQIGDILPYSLGEYDGGEYQQLNSIDIEQSKNNSRNIIKQPKVLTENLAWFIGLYFADGSNHTQIRIHGDISIQKGFNKCITIVENLFGINANMVKYNKDVKDKRCRIEINSDVLQSYLAANNLKKDKSHNISMPLIIRKSPKSVIEAFIDGFMTGDGNTSGDSWSMVTTSHNFAKQMVVVMRSIGRDCKYRIFNNLNSFSSRQRYWIQERKGRNTLHKNKKSNKKWLNESWGILDELGLNEFSADKIVQIDDGYSLTYDINVEDNHTYIANSFVSHNTGTLAAGIMGNGIHSMFGKFIIRNNRIKKHDPTYAFLKEIMPDFVEDEFNNEKDSAVISIPLRAPNGAITRNEPTIDMLNRIKRFSNEWIKTGHKKGCNTHNVSATVYVRADGWDEIATWMWKNRNVYNGITCLDFDGGNYKQAPFIEINEDQYNEMMSRFPKTVDFTQVQEDGATIDLVNDLACSSGSCEI